MRRARADPAGDDRGVLGTVRQHRRGASPATWNIAVERINARGGVALPDGRRPLQLPTLDSKWAGRGRRPDVPARSGPARAVRPPRQQLGAAPPALIEAVNRTTSGTRSSARCS
ncbi:MAG: hypothetical protein MZW92_33365 [Comamonadaceae bacterium]|nr:hypothetical protein [Comamonadaceae bacterium]